MPRLFGTCLLVPQGAKAVAPTIYRNNLQLLSEEHQDSASTRVYAKTPSLMN
jgi:hypothetical protein